MDALKKTLLACTIWHGQGGLVGCGPWGHRELDTTEWLTFTSLSFCQVWSDISLWFWLVFSWWLVMLNTFSRAYWPFVGLLWKTFGKCLWKNVCSGLCLCFLNQVICSIAIQCVSTLCSLDIYPLSDVWFTYIFSCCIGCLRILLMVFFAVQKL